MTLKIFIVLGITILTTSIDCQAAELAKIGSEVVTTEQFTDAIKALGKQGEMVAMNPDLKKRFLDHMINSRLVANLAKKEGFENDSKFKTRLRDMTEQLLAGEYMDRTLERKMTESATKQYFAEHKTDFSDKEIRASHALLETEEEAKKVLTSVSTSGADFDQVAKKHSKDKTVDLGFFKRGRMIAEFDKAAFATPKGKIHSKVVHTSFGWHVIKVVDIRGDDQVNYDKVKEDVKVKFRSSLQEALMRDLRQKTVVVINDEAVKGL